MNRRSGQKQRSGGTTVLPRRRSTAAVSHERETRERSAQIAVVAAYVAWGVLPIYWKLFSAYPAELVIFERTVWSFLGLGALFATRGELGLVTRKLIAPQVARRLLVSSMLLSANWSIYLWAIKVGMLAEASLGYLLCPVFSILLGAVFGGERLNRLQGFAVLCMVIGVSVRVLLLGSVPWVALGVAATFSLYTFTRKKTSVAATEGLFFETGAMLPIVTGAYLLRMVGEGSGVSLGRAAAIALGSSPHELLLFVSTGAMTAVPLLWLIAGAKRASMQFVGAAQYLTPTLSLLIAVLLYGERFQTTDAISFGAIWAGVMLMIVGGRSSGFTDARGVGVRGIPSGSTRPRLPVADRSSPVLRDVSGSPAESAQEGGEASAMPRGAPWQRASFQGRVYAVSR